MPEMPAKIVHPPNGISKNGPSTISQQFRRILKEQSAVMQKFTGFSRVRILPLYSGCDRSCKYTCVARLLLPFHFYIPTSSVGEEGSCEQFIPFCTERPELGGSLICSYH